MDTENAFTFVDAPVGDEPWRREQNGLGIRVTVREVKDWKIQHFKRLQRSMSPRAKCRWYDKEGTFTPKVFPIKDSDPLGEACSATLVPYATTRLRIAIFPIVNKD